MTHHTLHTANPLREIVIGAVAGAAGAFVMEQFQSAWIKYGSKLGLPQGPESDGPSAPEDAADRAVVAATGEHLPDSQRQVGAEAVHYVTGAIIGATYGVIASSVRGSTLGAGVPLGVASYFLLDKGLVPRLELGNAAGSDDKGLEIYAVASHIVFGLATDLTRRLLGAR